jgi:hypothetical protein
MRQDHGKTSVAVRKQDNRVHQGERPASKAAPFQGLTGAAVQRTSVTAEVPVAKVCPVEVLVEVVPAVEDSVVVPVAEAGDSVVVRAAEAAEVAAEAVEEGGSHVKI